MKELLFGECVKGAMGAISSFPGVAMSKLHSTAAIAAFAIAAPAAFAGGYQPPVIESGVAAVVTTEASHGDWAGAYVGATLGYVVSGDERVGFSDSADNFIGDVGKVDLSGVTGGVRLGYRFQREAWVFGVELGYEAMGVDGDVSFDNRVGDGTITSNVDNVTALRFKTARVIDEQTLFYGIAGLAHGKFSYDLAGTVPPATDTSKSYSHSGYVLGLGVERKLSDQLSVTGEWEYGRFGKTDLDLGGVITRATPKYNQLRLGVNYRF